MSEDSEVWAKFKQGDEKATSEIYHRNIQLLYRYGSKFTTDTELVKDSIQELFFDLIRTRINLGSTDNVCFYLIKAFRRRLILELKKREHPVEVDQYDRSYFFNLVNSHESELIERETISHREDMIRRALESLSPKQREILFYRYSCDFNYSQICDIMDIKYDSARKLVFRSLAALKESLRDMDFVL